MTTMTVCDTPILDESIRAQLRAVLGPAAETIFTKGREQVARLVGELTEAAHAGDADRAADRAHELGGVAGQIGFSRLSAMALAVERSLRASDATRGDYAAEIAEAAAEAVAA